MTINDQIRDENLQYDIKREAAKISALSSGKIRKYEYLTGEEILPSNQQQIIEEAKFTCSPLGKAFEKQIKTIEDQGEKQIKAIQDQGQVKTIKKYTYDDEDTPLISKQKKIFNELADERLKKITELNKKVNYDNLLYEFTGKTKDTDFNQFDHTFSFSNKIRDGKVSLTNAKIDQENFNKDPNEAKRGNTKHKSKKQKNALYNIDILCKAREEVIKFFDDYSSMVSGAKNRTTKRLGLKILTPKQMLQRLPIALAQVKAGNNSESLLNEIRQIVYSLYQSKQITKKVYNNIIKSINI